MHKTKPVPSDPPWLTDAKRPLASIKYEHSQKLQTLKNKFLDYLWKSKDFSPHTVKAYSLDVSRFLLYFDKSAKPLGNYRTREFEEFLGEQQTINSAPGRHNQDRLASSSRQRLAASLSQFLKFLLKIEFLDKDLTSFITRPKRRDPEPHFLQIEHLKAMVSSPGVGRKTRACMHTKGCYHPVLWPTEKECVRDRLFIRLLFSTGIRINDLAKLRVNRINMNEGSILVVKGKGGISRTVYFDESTANTIKDFLTLENKNLADYLFFRSPPTDMQQKVFRNFVNRRLKICARETGVVSINVSPHMLRHSFATDLLGKGADVRKVQEALGHKNLSTTQIYTHIISKEVRDTVKKHHTSI